MNIGSVGSYVKTMDMENKWRTKKNSGNFAADGAKTVGEWIEQQKKKTVEKKSSQSSMGNKSDSTLTAINYKLAKGSKLTPAEKEYLRKKDAAAYQRVQNIEATQKDFENKLRQCKTKEEVRKLKLTYVASALYSVNSIKNSPYIPEGAKAGLISEQQQLMAAIDRSHTDFVKSGEFALLPTEAERAEAAKKLAEAESGGENRSEAAVKEKPKESAKPKRTAKDTDGGESRPVTEKKHTKPAKPLKSPEGARKIAAKAKAEQSYAVRKVRRTRKPYRSASSVGIIAAAGKTAAADTVNTANVNTRAAISGSKLDTKA